MGRFLERTIRGTVATYYPDEGHHLVMDRWREILAVVVAEARSRVPSQARVSVPEIPVSASPSRATDILLLRDPLATA